MTKEEFKGLFDAEKTVITDGEERVIVAGEDYIKLSITDPEADIVKGYAKGLMQSYTDVVSEEDIAKMIDYIKTIK